MVVYGQTQALHTETLQIQHVESAAFIKLVCPGVRCPIAKSSVNGVHSLMSMRGDFAACRCSPPPPSDSAIAAGLATSLIGKEGFRQMRLTHIGLFRAIWRQEIALRKVRAADMETLRAEGLHGRVSSHF